MILPRTGCLRPTNSSECLTQAHVELERVVNSRPSIQGKTHIQSEGTNRREVADPGTRSPAETVVRFEETGSEGGPAVEEGDQAELFRHPQPGLEREFGDRPPAHRFLVHQRPDRLVGIATDRSSTASVEALVRRDGITRGAHNRTRRPPARQEEGWRPGYFEVVGSARVHLEKPEISSDQILVGSELHHQTAAAGRVKQIIARIPPEGEGKGDGGKVLVLALLPHRGELEADPSAYGHALGHHLLQAGGAHHAPATIGPRNLFNETETKDASPLLPADDEFPKGRLQGFHHIGRRRRKGETLSPMKEVSMLPRGGGAEALVRSVAHAGTHGPFLALGYGDSHRQFTFLVEALGGSDLDHGKEPGLRKS